MKLKQALKYVGAAFGGMLIYELAMERKCQNGQMYKAQLHSDGSWVIFGDPNNLPDSEKDKIYTATETEASD